FEHRAAAASPPTAAGCTLFPALISSRVAIVFSMRRMVATALFLLGAGTLLQAQFPVPTQRQLEDQGPPQMRELVSRYCRLDYEGSRLDPKAWSKFQPLVWWR